MLETTICLEKETKRILLTHNFKRRNRMTFKEAKDYIMPFGKHRGKRLDDIASEDEGLKYLDWLYGEVSGSYYEPRDALAAYLSDSSIKKELENL